jgi:hypothetical protein
LIARGKGDEDEGTRLASWMADALLSEKSFLGSAEYESVKSTCPEFAKRMHEYTEYVGKTDPKLPPNIAFLHLDENERVLPSGRRIDFYPLLNIRKEKGVPESRDQRLQKYKERKEAVTARPKPGPINTLPKKRTSKLVFF